MARSKKNARNTAQPNEAVQAPVDTGSLIKTASEVAAMSADEQAAFREAGGTAVEDHALN